MLALTAREILALSALRDNHPMTSLELSHAVSDLGMHSADAKAAVRSLAGQGGRSGGSRWCRCRSSSGPARRPR
jgi:hypothetical protein